MTQLLVKDLRTLSTQAVGEKVLGVLQKAFHSQATAADATGSEMTNGVVTNPGKLRDAYVVVGAVPASGESCAFTLNKNGVAIATVTLTSANCTVKTKQYKMTITGTPSVDIGDVLTVTRDYTAGGGPTPMANTVVVAEVS